MSTGLPPCKTSTQADSSYISLLRPPLAFAFLLIFYQLGKRVDFRGRYLQLDDSFLRGRACRSAPAARGAADHVHHLIRRHRVCSRVGWPRQLPLCAFGRVPGLCLSIRRSCPAVPQGRVSQGCPVAIRSDGGPPTSVAASPGYRVRNRDAGVSCLCPHRRHRLILASTGTVPFLGSPL